MHDEGYLDALGLRRSENLQGIYTGGDQTVALHSHPLIRVRGAVLIDPLHFLGSITGRDNSRRGGALQSIREAQNFLLLRRRQAADLVQDGFFETHATPLLMIQELAHLAHRRLHCIDDSTEAVNRIAVNCIKAPLCTLSKARIEVCRDQKRRFEIPDAGSPVWKCDRAQNGHAHPDWLPSRDCFRTTRETGSSNREATVGEVSTASGKIHGAENPPTLDRKSVV